MNSVILMCAGAILASPISEKELAKKTRDGVQRVLSNRRSWKFHCEDTRFHSTPATKVFRATYSYNGRHPTFLWRETTETGKGDRYESATAVNQRYGFDVKQRETGVWVMRKLAVGPQSTAIGGSVESDWLRGLLLPDCKLFIHDWASVVSEPTFRILEQKLDAREWTISFTSNGPFSRGCRVVRGIVVLDPDMCFLRKYQAAIQFDSNETATYFGSTTHAGAIDGIPIVSRHEYKDLDQASGKTAFSLALNFTDVGPGDIHERDATLTAFGLSEPSDLRPKPWSIPFFVWALIVGVVAIGGASILRYRRQRQV